MYAMIVLLMIAELLLCGAMAAPPCRRAISSPPPADSEAPSGSFEDFANIHLTPTEPPSEAIQHTSIGFHIQLGHSTTVATGEDIQLSNYSGLKKGLFGTGPPSFEAFNGSFCPPVTGYYHLAAIVHLTASSVTQHAELEVTVGICLAGFCHNPSTGSLEAVTATSGIQTVSVSGLLALTTDDAAILHVSTNNVTMATIMGHSSFMAFLLG